jgi:hypothetical protein
MLKFKMKEIIPGMGRFEKIAMVEVEIMITAELRHLWRSSHLRMELRVIQNS